MVAMRMLGKTVFIAWALIACSGCRTNLPPSSSVIGDWSGRVVPNHSANLMLRLTQGGPDLVGTACYQDTEGPGNGVRFSGVPVQVSYPNAYLAVPMGSDLAGWSFIGAFTSDGMLTGHYAQGNVGSDMVLTRGGNYCGL
jgi:hypothetical protein